MIESDNLYLKPVTEEDRDFFIKLYTDQKLMKLVLTPQPVEFYQQLFNEALTGITANGQRKLIYIIKSKTDKISIGVTGFIWNQNQPSWVENGIILTQKFHNQGITIGLFKSLFEHAFGILKITKIIGVCQRKNIAANKFIAKIGFIKTTKFYDIKNQHIEWELTHKRFKNFFN